MSLITDALDILIPASCTVCSKRLVGRIICSSCTPKVVIPKTYCLTCQTIIQAKDQSCDACKVFPPRFHQQRFLWDYQKENVSNFINCFKYKPSLPLCKVAGKILASNIPKLFNQKDWDLIIPIPSSQQSINQRLFNQCAVMALEVHGFLRLQGISVNLCYKSLRHRGYAEVQASLSHSERLQNVKNAFIAEKNRVKGKKILLIEDVITTGATSTAACRKLIAAGAFRVDIVALARSISWSDYHYINM